MKRLKQFWNWLNKPLEWSNGQKIGLASKGLPDFQRIPPEPSIEDGNKTYTEVKEAVEKAVKIVHDFANIPPELADKYQDLFNFLTDEHDLWPTVEQMDEIILEVGKFKAQFEEENKLLTHIKKQAEYCDKMAKKPEFQVSKYSKKNHMTQEQMSGYYQGRGEANWNVIYKLEDSLKSNT